MNVSPLGKAGAVTAAQTDRLAGSHRVAASAASVVAPEVSVGADTVSLQAAQAEMAQMPEVDAARVAEIKSALARGEISFDPQKLAQLVVRHHGGRG